MARDRSLIEMVETILHHRGIPNSGEIADEIGEHLLHETLSHEQSVFTFRFDETRRMYVLNLAVTEEYMQDFFPATMGQSAAVLSYLSGFLTGRFYQRTPDFIYDPENWEYTLPWSDRDTLAEGLDPNVIHSYATLYKGPGKHVVTVHLDTDGDGEQDDYETKWFDHRYQAEDYLKMMLGEATPSEEHPTHGDTNE